MAHPPPGWWFVELGLNLARGAYYVARARGPRLFGRRALAVVGVVILLHAFNAPWLPPL